MQNITFVGEIKSPTTFTTLKIFDKDLNEITPDYIHIGKINQILYSYETVISVGNGITDNLYYIRINNEIRPLTPIVYNSVNTFSFSLGNLPVNPVKTWLSFDPILLIDGQEESFSPLGLSYTPTSTDVIIDSGESIVEWFSYSSASILDNSSLNVGSGIVFAFVLRKKNSTTVNCTLVEKTGEYLIEIVNDEIQVDSNTTGIHISESYTLYVIHKTPSGINIWVNETLTVTI